LLIYQGSTITEDSLLNLSGFLAFVVGLVPTPREKLRGPGLPRDFDSTLFAENSMWALLTASVVAAVAVLIIQKLSPVPKDPQDLKIQALPVPPRLKVPFRWAARPMACVEALLPWAPPAALVVGAVFFIIAPDAFIEGAHGIAAFTMFCGIILVVVHYAFYALLRPQRRLIFVAAYIVIAPAMVVTLGLAAALHLLSHGHGVIIVEAIVIFEFAVFWLTQSIDLWKLEKYQVPSLSQLLTGLAADTPARP
jgi:magnesium-transporting ATPase (P-type)